MRTTIRAVWTVVSSLVINTSDNAAGAEQGNNKKEESQEAADRRFGRRTNGTDENREEHYVEKPTRWVRETHSVTG
jgi:hypothetical protein